MKYDDLRHGMTVILDEGFYCHPGGPAKVFWDEDFEEFYFECKFGKHFLKGQLDFDDAETLVGIEREV
jgi:hypothetical protein